MSMRVRALCFVVAVLLTSASNTALAGPPERKPIVEKGSEQASRGFIEESLETLDNPESRARLGRILNSQEMRDATRDLTASLVLGVVDGISTARSAGPMTDAQRRKAMLDTVNRQVAPALGQVAYRVADSALDAALSDEHMARIQILGENSTQALVRGFSIGVERDLGPALAATLEKDIGPAVAIVVERDLVPALVRALDTPEVRRVLANNARSLATEFVGGAGQAIEEETDEGGLQVFGNKIAAGYAIALFVAFALGTMTVVLTVVLVRNTRRIRKQTQEASEREQALLHLIDSLKSETPELKADVRQLLEDELSDKS
jgi:hypothetical protein